MQFVRALVLAGSTAFFVAGSACVAAAEGPAGADATASVLATATPYDRAVDPTTVAMRRALAAAGTHGTFLNKRDAAAVARYYEEQGYAPAWTTDAGLTDRALQIIARIKQADTDGLNPSDYLTPPTSMRSATPAELAHADVVLSQAIVAYARHAHAGRQDPAAISDSIGYEPHLPDPVAVLAGVAGADDPAAALASFNPASPEFAALRAKLAEIRAMDREPLPIVPPGANLALGSVDPRVAILRQRLNVTEPTDTPNRFDEAVDLAVRGYQDSKGLSVDGIVGRGTLARLNADADDHVATIIANMERWRWMPEDLGDYYVRVNVPNYNLDIYRDDAVVLTTRIIVGEPDNQTPIFSDEIEHVIVNPTWHVPASIAVKEMLPEIRTNPYTALAGFQVFANINGQFQQIDPYRVDWWRVDMGLIQIKQPPGPQNALGSVKFMFPNRFSVYLHDTPTKNLFERDYRAYSHGCMRVMDPWGFAQALLSAEPAFTVDQLRDLVGGRERQVNLTNHIPVHVTYFTAWVDDDGALQVRDDIYGIDARMQSALGLQS